MVTIMITALSLYVFMQDYVELIIIMVTMVAEFKMTEVYTCTFLQCFLILTKICSHVSLELSTTLVLSHPMYSL